MAKKNWLKQAQQAARELKAAQRKLYRYCGSNTNLIDMAAIELLGFYPGQRLICLNNSFSAFNVMVGYIWEVDFVGFSNERNTQEQEVLSRNPWLAVMVRRGYGMRWLHGTRHAFHKAFAVTDSVEEA